MKRILLSVLGLTSLLVQAQTTDTVSLGAGYANQTYYQISTGDEHTGSKSDWDIAFQVSGIGSSISINHATGTQLWQVSTDTSDWATLDINDLSSWTQYHNADTSLAYGAFSQNQGGLDLGWGTYDFITHFVVGDELFVIELANGDYQKVWIKQLASGIYTFRHANMDNSMDMTHTIDKDDYENRVFAYFSLQNHQAIDKEPNNEGWELLFGQYGAADQGYYNVSGVLLNEGIEAIDVAGEDVGTFVSYEDYSFDNALNVIGYDWKTYDWTQGWLLDSDRMFFVKDFNDDVYKIVFTEFGGSSNGNFIFTKELMIDASNVEEHQTNLLNVFPNPNNGAFNLTYSSNESAEYFVYDINGKLVASGSLIKGFAQESIQIENANSGIYFLNVISSNGIEVVKVSVK